MRLPMRLRPIAFIALVACGHAAPLPVSPPPGRAGAVPASPASAAAASTPDVIRRSQIRAALAAGPGAFLQKVSLDDHPVFLAGKFHGFRITALEAEAFRGVDLAPGDVVTRIEGMPIEHPEEAIEAFNALQVASELRVDYERDGLPRILRYRIVEDEATGAPGRAVPTPTGRP